MKKINLGDKFFFKGPNKKKEKTLGGSVSTRRFFNV